MENQVRVGVAVILKRDGKVLCGKRKNSHGAETWGFPGGHLEFGESWEECAAREVFEETGLVLERIRFGTVTNDIFAAEQKHYITVFMIADYVNGSPQLLEPNKCETWEWFDWNALPDSIFLPIKNLQKLNFNPFS